MVVNSNGVLKTWKALHGELKTPGWRSIDLFQAGTCLIKLARHSPSGHEAVLIGFANTKLAPTPLLPKGQGFRMERATLGETSGARQWLAIVKQPSGCIDLFAAVVADITALMAANGDCSEDLLHQRLMGRVRGWQEFMRKGQEGLSKEAEQGLIGELCFLNHLIESGMLTYSVVDGWKGPADGLHDFVVGMGSIEVKSTIGKEGFAVRIASLDQLDDSRSSPLYLAGVRLEISDRGRTLTRYVTDIRSTLEPDPAALALFEKALHDAGYLDMHSENYSRKFLPTELRILLVDSDFPRLIPFNTPPAICWAQYEIDLSLIATDTLALPEVLEKLGVI
ncbi:hypothetical protein PMI38_00678 [Pseudomonas sp. GM84]|nr:hypothetical protein PMI38_00678 [Pseudomonas sp. GM84]